MSDSLKLWPFWTQDVANTVSQLVTSGETYHAGSHSLVRQFESEFRRRLDGSPTIAVSSGTVGLQAAYFALNLPAGSEVLVPTLTFRATVTPLIGANLVPIFYDCDSNGQIDIEDASRRLTPRTKAIVVTHLNGLSADMDQVKRLSQENNLHLVEDCSHAHGGRQNGQPLGTFGDISVFSCGSTKIISGGGAGIVASDNVELFERAALYCLPKSEASKRIGNAQLRRLTSSGVGTNPRITPIAAALALSHTHELDHIIEAKNNNLTQMRYLLSDRFPNGQLLDLPDNATGTLYKAWVRFPTVEETTAAETELRAIGLSTGKPLTPLHQLPLYTSPTGLTTIPHSPKPEESCPNSIQLSSHCVELTTRDMYNQNLRGTQ